MRDEIDHILKEKLVNGDPLTELSGWDRLEKELIAADEKKKRREKLFFVLRFSRYAALGLLVVGLSYLTFKNNTSGLTKNNPLTVPSVAVESSDNVEVVDPTENPSQAVAEIAGKNLSEEISTDLAVQSDKEQVIIASADITVEFVEKIAEGGTEYGQGLIGESVQQPENNLDYSGFKLINPSVPVLFPETDGQPILAQADRLDIDQYLQEFDQLYGEEETDDKKWWISTTADVLSLNSNYFGTNFVRGQSMFEKIGQFVSNIQLNEYYDNEFYEYTGGLPFEQLTSGDGLGLYVHDLLFSAGFSINKEISERYGVGTGMALKKTWARAGNLKGSHYEQTVIYVGVPIILNYNLLPESSNWDIKLLLGVTGDKAFFTEGKDCLSLAGVITEYPASLKKPSKIMLSSNTGVGIGYRIVRGINLYIEPNFRYTIYSKGQPITFYTDRLFGFVVKTGLNVEF